MRERLVVAFVAVTLISGLVGFGFRADGWGPALLLFVLLALAAAAIGYLLARWIAAPFRRLAVAAAALGRGRFQLDLPRTRIPEARAIGAALAGSAEQIEERLARDRRLAEHASHSLRTPLTALRLELEELSLEELPPALEAAVARGIARVDQLDAVTGELVALSRESPLAGAQVPLRDLAGQCTRRWADELGRHDRPLSAQVEGEVDTAYTPGPVEQILDLLLVEVVTRSRGAVRVGCHAATDGLLAITVSAAEATPQRRSTDVTQLPLVRARAVAGALGGRVEGSGVVPGLSVLLPRR